MAGTNFLPGKEQNAGSGPAPTPAQNSGTKQNSNLGSAVGNLPLRSGNPQKR